MILSNVIVGNLLFEDDDELAFGKKCLVNIGPSRYMVGTFHCYNTEEYCFKECTYYMNKDEHIVKWLDHPLKPISWVNKNSLIWCKSTIIEN